MNNKKFDFVEFYNMNGSKFYGEFIDLNAAKLKLNVLREKGELLAQNHAVLMYCCHFEDFRPVRNNIQVVKYLGNTRVAVLNKKH